MALLDEDREEIKNIFGELLGGEREKWKQEQEQNKPTEEEEEDKQEVPEVLPEITNEEVQEQDKPEEIQTAETWLQKLGKKANHLW